MSGMAEIRVTVALAGIPGLSRAAAEHTEGRVMHLPGSMKACCPPAIQER